MYCSNHGVTTLILRLLAQFPFNDAPLIVDHTHSIPVEDYAKIQARRLSSISAARCSVIDIRVCVWSVCLSLCVRSV